MSVQPGPTFKRYAANGVATVYPIPFLLLDAADLQITLNGVPVTTGFTLTGIGNPTSSCTFTPAPTGDLLFQMVVPFQRLADYQINGDFLAQTVNRDYDRLWLAIKQLSRDNTRGLTVSLLEPEGIPPLPAKAARSLKMLAFDANGDPITSTLTLAQIEQQPALALSSAQAAAASALSASNSKDAAALSAVSAGDSAILAQKWAENPEDAPVIAGLFSAHHWAIKSALAVQSMQKQIMPFAASVATNVLFFSLLKTPISFRSPTLGVGTVNTRDIPNNLFLSVPVGATLGTANGVLGRLIGLAIDVAGTVELAIVNQAGGLNLDETGLISTTALSAASTSANVIYSATARSNVPYRVIGFAELTQAAAGTWATDPSRVQGAGGLAMSSLIASWNWQAPQNVIGSRVAGTPYRNNSARPLAITVTATSGSASTTIDANINGSGLMRIATTAAGTGPTACTGTVTVPPFGSVVITTSGALSQWWEQ
ncbi:MULTISPECIES: hypothetical protein [unclassified Pseudomonas]|uniref:hypothetical protein n=1 Tax=unclassified Pseudomonas TaxID=196821 RepID=UPI000C883684|nr:MULTISPECIES: hypothetical protein [unclassified Pseudomonas]PMX29232.1 hypothetical protein C1Y23_01390 [Pseudomonas sp. GW460-12]PMX36911.1 hypothetical protein C1Y24_04530 [Pseudomonas sp. MPR-R2A4]PMX43307.1 hypothetical protein C1Y26_03400 [Pseudomonas sp. MPR-R2A7]PMX53292.1 hypothetical protein C1Y17_14085 [Pseudomonas sp. MPR-R2A6]PMX93432.1 hypothetical protein C1Y21_02945 [Pseudomonas sp. MPR-R2A3]